MDRVVTAFVETGIDVETGIELVRVGERLLAVADTVPIDPGTARTSVAGVAVYAADRFTPGKALTQADVVEAVSETVPTSMVIFIHLAILVNFSTDIRIHDETII
ncbi:hypothetical protein JZX76_05425 [Haloarcula hispanica]|uniref:Uncharacterized protein n=1 Tax=Haloarcula hispanica TaxID=51589 RepID=A0A482T3S7_HALHI|nr:hypothetical protein [Haloarcula hispanica]MCJ0618977.1 hypothetical protein [Haloarcula hispanica]RYJ09510.1 hypothetical protein ELS20_05400 [Haloarcula hispanica]